MIFLFWGLWPSFWLIPETPTVLLLPVLLKSALSPLGRVMLPVVLFKSA